DVDRVWAQALVNIRTKLDTIPAKCCAKCRELVDLEIGAALEELSTDGIIPEKESGAVHKVN
ncbi:MAG: hypothetical protein ACRD2R_06260, partial [Terriglobales bacterium]